MVTVLDVTKYILERRGQMPTWKLQKLVYYCQAWSLVWVKERLFSEKIEAWENGPVVRELFDHHKNLFDIRDDQIPGDSSKLSVLQKETIDMVLNFYGDKSSQWLRDLVHDEDPWRKTREGLLDGQECDREISIALMNEYYSSLLKDYP